MTQHTKTFLKLLSQLIMAVCLSFNAGFAQTSKVDTIGTIISDPLSIDSLFVIPSIPYEGDTIELIVGTTHSSSPCGLLDYNVSISTGNVIYVNARYWQGMLTAICHSTDKMRIGPLPAGKYVLNFMNREKIEFVVYPRITGCNADFSYSYPKCGDAKCINAVAFKDNSTGNIQSWLWDFGDSTFSTLQNPQHTYKNNGVYNVCLTVKGDSAYNCADKVCKLVPLSLCQAKFTYEVVQAPTASPTDSMFAPMPMFLVKFTDMSVGNVVKWYWNFGDNSISEEQSPSHIFRTGKYSVILTISTSSGCMSTYYDTLVLVNTVPQCQYMGTVRDYSGLDGCKYVIELDNGVKLNPVIMDVNFLLIDSMRVMLDYRPLKIATTCMLGIPAEISCIREIVTPTCKAGFSWYWDRTTKIGCNLFVFTDKSDGLVNSWHWDFGDGSTSNLKNPKHCYPLYTDSVYTVCLTITTANGCTSTHCEKVFSNYGAPWKPVIGGDENHNIIVPADISNTNLEPGDYIGLFFRDYYGKLVCGGMSQWENKNTVLTAWQNVCYFDTMIIQADSLRPIPCRKNGFWVGEKFEYKIWKYRTNEEIYVQNAGYKVSNLFPDSGFFEADGLSLLCKINFGHKQHIKVHTGWNLLSANVEPYNASMSDIFGSKNVIVKNYLGEIVYFPKMDMYEGVWNKYEGYKVKAFEDFTLTIEGEPIPLDTNIPLAGEKLPYFLPYYFQVVHPIEDMLIGLKKNIRYVQSIEYVNGVKKALNYIPRFGINQIGYMKPGLGYKLSLYNLLVRSFTYPHAKDSIIYGSSTINGISENIPASDNNRILVIPANALPIVPGSMVVASTSNGVVVGEELADSSFTALTMWDLESGLAYDSFILKVSSGATETTYNLSFSQNTEQDGEIYVLESTTENPIILENNAAVKAYPTLVKDELNIDITLGKIASAEVSIFNMVGNKLYSEKFTNLSAGNNTVTIALGNLKQGQYMYQVKTYNNIARGKIQIVK